MENINVPSRTDRKTMERNRRIYMGTLYSKLNSIIPQQWTSKEGTLLPDQLEEAANYIKVLKERIEKMEEKKRILVMGMNKKDECVKREVVMSLQPPQIDIHDLGSALMVVVISGLDGEHLFYELIRATEEEGAEVVNAGFVVVGDKIIHTIHAQVPDSGYGFESSMVSERLKKVIDGMSSR